MKNTNKSVLRGHLQSAKTPLVIAALILSAQAGQAQSLDAQILSDSGLNSTSQPMGFYFTNAFDQWMQENAVLQTGLQPDGVSPYEGDGMVCMAQSGLSASQVRQRIDVSALSNDIDLCEVTAVASGWVNASTSGVVGGSVFTP